ncbi:putative Ras GTPase-activating protein-binding protein [Helianthus annuus]|nr:putative Ras GTPase-activating protein-binding protein [Helianthus annuus]
MASSYSSSVTVSKVGSKFVQHYYEVLQRQPELAHRFYTASSSIIRVDGESTQSASDISQIQTLVESLHVRETEIKTVNSVGSWSRGITVVVSGSVKSDSFSGRRKFVQTFSLALVQPFSHAIVMNDIFHYVSEEDLSGVIYEKDVTDIFNIKRNDSETVEDFTSRFTKESSQIPQASDDIKISAFIYGVCNDQLVKNLKQNYPKTFKDMIHQVRGFVRGEKACALLKDAETQKPARAMRPKKRNRGSRRAASFRGSRRNTFSPYHPMRQDHSSQIMDGTTLRTNDFQEAPLVVTLQCPVIVSGFMSFDVRDMSIGG